MGLKLMIQLANELRRTNQMKKFMTLMLGLSFLTSVALVAQDQTDTTKKTTKS